MARLRGDEGCPWDREQTALSLRRQLVEECYETVEAIDSGRPDRLRDELGDLMLHIVFQARIGEEAGAFAMPEVLRGINQKLIRRHPHVFGPATVEGAEEVVEQWDEIKALERAGRGERRDSALDGTPRGLPQLLRAELLQKRAAKVGFDWPDAAGPAEKIAEEAAELTRSSGDVEEELGDLLFAVVNLARFLRVSPELALGRACAKFDRRFRRMEALAGESGPRLSEMTLEEMDVLWETAKTEEAAAPPVSRQAGTDGAPCDSTSS